MRISLVTATGIALASCASMPNPTDEPWHPTSNGCFRTSIYETLMWGSEAPLSAASFRLAVSPDTGQGPTVLVVLDSGKLVNLGQPDGAPYVLSAVGTSEKTCVVKIPWFTCSAADSVYNELRNASLPLGFRMDDPAEILVFHAPTYYLEFSDGLANHNLWRFYGSDHPLQKEIDSSIESLRPCWAPAELLYNEF